MNTSFNAGIILFILLYCNAALAGGPLVIEGADGNTAVSYQDADVSDPDTDVSLDVENGDLGELITNAEANEMVETRTHRIKYRRFNSSGNGPCSKRSRLNW